MFSLGIKFFNYQSTGFFMANNSRLPNFKSAATSRAIVTGMVGTALGVVVVVPVYNKFLAPLTNKVINEIKNAGFLPSA